MARGVPRRRRGSLTLRATSRQLRGACGSPAVRRECAKTRTPRGCRLADPEARSQWATVTKLHAKPYHRTRYDGCLTRVNVKGGVDVSNCISCKDRKTTRPNNGISIVYECSSDFLSRSSVKVVRGRGACRNLCMEAHDRHHGRNT